MSKITMKSLLAALLVLTFALAFQCTPASDDDTAKSFKTTNKAGETFDVTVIKLDGCEEAAEDTTLKLNYINPISAQLFPNVKYGKCDAISLKYTKDDTTIVASKSVFKMFKEAQNFYFCPAEPTAGEKQTCETTANYAVAFLYIFAKPAKNSAKEDRNTEIRSAALEKHNIQPQYLPEIETMEGYDVYQKYTQGDTKFASSPKFKAENFYAQAWLSILLSDMIWEAKPATKKPQTAEKVPSDAEIQMNKRNELIARYIAENTFAELTQKLVSNFPEQVKNPGILLDGLDQRCIAENESSAGALDGICYEFHCTKEEKASLAAKSTNACQSTKIAFNSVFPQNIFDAFTATASTLVAEHLIAQNIDDINIIKSAKVKSAPLASAMAAKELSERLNKGSLPDSITQSLLNPVTTTEFDSGATLKEGTVKEALKIDVIKAVNGFLSEQCSEDGSGAFDSEIPEFCLELPASTTPESTTTEETPAATNLTKAGTINANTVNVLKDANDATTTDTLTFDTAISIYEEKKGANGYQWYRITFTSDTNDDPNGWIRSDNASIKAKIKNENVKITEGFAAGVELAMTKDQEIIVIEGKYHEATLIYKIIYSEDGDDIYGYVKSDDVKF